MQDRIPKTLQGILYMMLSMLAFSIMNTLIRGMAADIHTFFMVFVRNAISLCLFAYVPLRGGLAVLRTKRISGHLWRGVVGILSMELWFHAVSLMPLTQAIALSFTTPIFITVFAILFLGEKAGLRRWAAILIGFLGAMMILRPSAEGLNHAAFFVLGASAMVAVATILVKNLTKTEAPEVIVFYMALFFTLFSFPPSLGHWQTLSLNQWLGMFGIALFSSIAQLSLAKAYTKADMVMLMPFDFTRLIFVTILAYFFFGETLDLRTLLGGLVILGSSLYIVHREVVTRSSPLIDAPEIKQ